MIVYNDILGKLAEKGYTSAMLQKEGLLSGSVQDRIRHNVSITMNVLDAICHLLRCQPGDILTWIPDEKSDM